MLILPETPKDVVLSRAEEIRRSVSHLQIFQRGQLLESTSVSMGVAIFPEHSTSGEDLLRAADHALYRAKALGRNRVVVADAEPDQVIEKNAADLVNRSGSQPSATRQNNEGVTH